MKLTATFYIVWICALLLGNGNQALAIGAFNMWKSPSVQVDTVGPGPGGIDNGGTSQTLSWSHTCSGTNRLLLVGVEWENTTSGVSFTVTYNGVPMTALGYVIAGGQPTAEGFIQFFYLVAPPTGSHTVLVTASGGNSSLGFDTAIIGGSISFNGVNQTTPLRNLTSTYGNGTALSLNINSAPGDLVVDLVTSANSVTSSGTTLRWVDQYGATAQSTAYGSGIVNMNYIFGGSEADALMAVDVVAAEASPNIPAPTQLVISSAAQSVPAYQCSNQTIVQLQSATGLPVSLSAPSTVGLSGTGFTFYSDSQCSNSVVSVNIPSGSTSANFWFTNTATQTLTAANGSYTSGTQAETITTTNSLGGNWSVVQALNYESNASGTTGTMGLLQTTRAGDLLVADCAITAGSAPTLSVSDNVGNTYVPSNEGRTVPWGGGYMEVFYALNSIAGAKQLTWNSTVSGTYFGCGFSEFINSGGVSLGEEPGTGPTHGENIVTGTTGSANQTISAQITTTQNGDLIYAFALSGDELLSSAAGFYSVTGGSYNVQDFRSQTTAGVINGSEVEATSGKSYVVQALSFEPP